MDEPDVREALNRIESIALDLQRRVTRLETLIESEGTRCPYREALARAQNNVDRTRELENKMEQMTEMMSSIRVEMARAGAYGGLVVSAVSVILAIVAKVLGWV